MSKGSLDGQWDLYDYIREQPQTRPIQKGLDDKDIAQLLGIRSNVFLDKLLLNYKKILTKRICNIYLTCERYLSTCKIFSKDYDTSRYMLKENPEGPYYFKCYLISPRSCCSLNRTAKMLGEWRWRSCLTFILPEQKDSNI